ncbi:MAG: hypothetical protein U1F43_32935 [Myxococcota bacterium]
MREELRAEIALGEVELLLSGIDDGGQRLRAAYRRVTIDNEDEALSARAALGLAHAMVARRLWADVFRYAERARATSRASALVARSWLAEADAHTGQDQMRKARAALEHALEHAKVASDGLLLEHVKQRLTAVDPVASVGESAA